MDFRIKIFGVLYWAAFSFPAAFAQKDASIYLQNPSFEDVPQSGKEPKLWYNCGPASESPPDVQPGWFECRVPAQHGSSYLGMVVRDNETWESVGQRLSAPLQKNQCYEFSLYTCRADHYVSGTKSGATANYVTPVKLIVWGGNGYCDKAEVLFETSVITNTRWLKTDMRFNPKKGNYSFIMFEAYYKTPVLFPYNGNVLLDNCSAIKPFQCGPEKMPEKSKEKPPLAVKSPEKKKNEPLNAPSIKVDTPSKKSQERPAVQNADVTVKTARAGEIFRLEKVYFDADKYEIKQECEPELTDLLNFLNRNSKIAIEVGGHTNNNLPTDMALQLSTNRAKAVADWLIARGVSSNRVSYKGYGWTQPVMPNTTAEGKKKNQRVEVKVLAMK